MKYSLLFSLLFIGNIVFAQRGSEKYKIDVAKAKDKITLDGKLDEVTWKDAIIAENFFLNKPFDSTYAKLDTKVRMAFDEEYLYIAAICYQPRKSYRVSSLKRDFAGGSSDVFTVNLDTYKDNLNGFHFAVNPYNVQREGLIDNSEDLSTVWDNKWYSKVTNHDDRWEVEMAIPFSTLRYKVSDGENSWRVNFGRMILSTNEVSTWCPVPRNFNPANLAFTGLLSWNEAPPRARRSVTLIPYITAAYNQETERDQNTLVKNTPVSDNSTGLGADAKITITPSLNLDLTYNPDFSQVEVDRQVANLSRFELFFPERRQFFIENSDLFSKWGFPETRPFFSRRIGLAFDPVRNQNRPVPIIGGARLSGKLTPNLRVGALNMQTKKVDFGNNEILPAANFTVLTAQQKVLQRSVLGGVLVNKQNFFSDLTSIQKEGFDKFNRIAGLEFNYFSPNGVWEAESYYHHSFTPTLNGGSLSQFVGYNTPNLNLRVGYSQTDSNYVADAGFVPRTGIRSLYTGSEVAIFPSKIVNILGISYDGNFTYDWKGKLLDVDVKVGPYFVLPDQSEGYAGMGITYTYLFEPFDPTNLFLNPNPDLRQKIVELPVGAYQFTNFGAGFTSSQRNNLSFSAEMSAGKYFNGRLNQISGYVGYRIQPYGNVQLTYGLYDFKMPAPYQSTRYWLLGPQADISFSKNLFFSTFFQYNTQTNNVNINSRLQWRFRPVSDLFIVFTDNYFAQAIPNYPVSAFSTKNRALIFKLTYWLNS